LYAGASVIRPTGSPCPASFFPWHRPPPFVPQAAAARRCEKAGQASTRGSSRTDQPPTASAVRSRHAWAALPGNPLLAGYLRVDVAFPLPGTPWTIFSTYWDGCLHGGIIQRSYFHRVRLQARCGSFPPPNTSRLHRAAGTGVRVFLQISRTVASTSFLLAMTHSPFLHFSPESVS
jgi:hypothetical protein